jgi:hypothetical protein
VCHRLFRHAADCQNAGLGRVDDRGEFVDIEHAQIGDRESAAGVLLGLEPALPRPGGEVS